MLTGDLFQPLTEKKKKPKPTKPDKWAYAKAEAKKKFDVYPSAYANAWAAKKYKELGGGWRMGEDTVTELADQQSDAPSKTYANQKLVNIMRKAAEVPGTGMTNDQRMFVAMYDELEDAVEKIGDVEKQNQELRKQIAKQAAPAAKAAEPAKGKEEPKKEPTAAQVKAQPAPKPTVQQVVQNITQVLQRAEQSAETPEQQKEVQAAKDRIADLEDKMDQLSNADVKEIEGTFVAIEKGGIKMGDVKRLLRVVDKRIEQSANEKAAQQQTLNLLKQQPPKVDSAEVKNIVAAELPNMVKQELQKLRTAASATAPTTPPAPTTVTKKKPPVSLVPADDDDEEDEGAAKDDPGAPVSNVIPLKAITPWKQQPLPIAVGQNESINEQDLSSQTQSTIDFRLPAARWIGIVDDWFAADWNKVYKQFEIDFVAEQQSDDPYEETPVNLQEAFKLPILVNNQIQRLAKAIMDLDEYMTAIWNNEEYRGLFTQVMFPAFKGRIYNKQVKSNEIKQDFINDYEFYKHYIRLTSEAMNKVQPFFRDVYKFVQKSHPESSQDDNAVMAWFQRNIISAYNQNRKDLRNAVNDAIELVKFMQKHAGQADLFERKKKKKSKSKKAFGGYYFPGYHYYGQGTAEISDGGGDGGGESMFEVVTKNRTPEETGALDSYYSRRRQPHKVVDGKRVELTDREEIQQYLDAYENETDRKDYGDMSEQRLYFRTVATLAESLEHDFGMQKDDKGWYLTPRSGRQRILDAERAFGTPQLKR